MRNIVYCCMQSVNNNIMSIPSYNEIYSFPGGYPPFGKPDACKHQRLKPSYVKETSKSVDICDKFNRLRYVVELSSQVILSGD